MIKCWHRECENTASHHIETPNSHVYVCDEHHAVLEHAQRHEGGYSTANTEDNVFGWRVRR